MSLLYQHKHFHFLQLVLSESHNQIKLLQDNRRKSYLKTEHLTILEFESPRYCHTTNKPTHFSLSSSVEPLSGNMEEMASKILSEGNFLVLSLLVRPGDDTYTLSVRAGNSLSIVRQLTSSSAWLLRS